MVLRYYLRRCRTTFVEMLIQIFRKSNIFDQSLRLEFPTPYAANNEAGISVSIVTTLRPERPINRGSIPETFLHNIQTSSGVHSVTRALGIVGCSCRGMKLTIHFYLVPNLGMHGAIFPFPHTSVTFILKVAESMLGQMPNYAFKNH
jgi:hypothetical protein